MPQSASSARSNFQQAVFEQPLSTPLATCTPRDTTAAIYLHVMRVKTQRSNLEICV